MPTRLIVAYGLIALMVLAAAAIAWWNVHHSQRRMDARLRARGAAYRLQDEEAASGAASSREKPAGES